MDYKQITDDVRKHFENEEKLRRTLCEAINEMLEARGGTVELNDDGDFNDVYLFVFPYDSDGGTEVYYIHAATSPDGNPSFTLETECNVDDEPLEEYDINFTDVCSVFNTLRDQTK